MNYLKNLGTIAIIITGLFFTACDDSESSASGNTSVEATDAAVAYENVNAVYLAVDGIEATLNGQTKTVATFSEPKVFNIMAYQNGSTYFMGSGDLEVGQYSDLAFVMSGNSSSYVELKDGTTKDLDIEGNSRYVINGAFEVASETSQTVVADIDLRKALVLNGSGDFMLRSTARLVSKSKAGTIRGKLEGQFDSSKEVIVYAYKKGTYSASEEAAPSSSSRTRFENSINSAVVNENGEYTLAFMEEGDYELIIGTYENEDNDNDLEFKGTLNANIMINGSILNKVTVESESSVEATLMIL